jgi:HD-like signal output (HDOD) protein
MKKFISRLTGELIETDKKTLNELYQENSNYIMTDEECQYFKVSGEILKNEIPLDNSLLDMLYSRWNFDHELIEKIFKWFENFDTTEKFLRFLDGSNIEDAWEMWCIDTGADHEIDSNPFL